MTKPSFFAARGAFARAGASGPRRWFWPGLLFLLVWGNAPAQEAGPAGQHHHSAAPLEAAVTRSEHMYYEPDAVLKDVDGRNVALRALLESDEPVMLDFIYTSCTAICPLLSETFAQVQRDIGDGAARLRMVSISIDPEYDTPKVLRAYAQTFHAGPQWRFLTGNPKDIAEVLTAFDAFRANKMDHAAIVLLRSSQGKAWIRFDGLVSPATLVSELRAMQR